MNLYERFRVAMTIDWPHVSTLHATLAWHWVELSCDSSVFIVSAIKSQELPVLEEIRTPGFLLPYSYSY